MNLATLERLTKEKPQTLAVLRALLPRNHAGGIIGYQGQSVKHVLQTYDVFIQLHQVEGSSWGRVISVKGEPTKLGRAWFVCANNLVGSYEQYYTSNGFSINFLIPTEFVEISLGHGDFEHIAMSSKTKITVKHDCLLRSTERVVQVKTNGADPRSLHCFETAVCLLAKLVEEKITMALSTPGTIFYIGHKMDNTTQYLSLNEKDVVYDFADKNVLVDNENE